MLVYGDAVRRESVGSKVANIRRYLAEAELADPWIVAHGLLVAALIEAGELAQGVTDRAFEAAGGRDGPSEESDAAMALTLALAEVVGRSWTDTSISIGGIGEMIGEVEAKTADGELDIKLPEGFAHYALYPETYYEAARPLAGRELTVIGLRSIGTTLAAMVAAGAGAPCPITVRPIGDPFGRALALAEPLSIAPGAQVAIADEGPGLSGSSIAAAVDALAASGVTPERIYVFPSHANGPGPQANQRTQRFWATADIHLRSFDDTILGAEAPHSLLSWVADLTGDPVGELREITGGGWREGRDWPDGLPPVHPWQEKRKFLLESPSGTWLVRFVGLGRIGLAKYGRAAALADAGFAPRPLGFRHGFTVERWHGRARAVDPFGPGRRRFLAHLGQYLGFRARVFRAPRHCGANGRTLFDMLRANIREEFGEALAEAVDRWRARVPTPDDGLHRIETDNRLQAWEWLVLPDGRILKCDAVDHHAGHDLVGCQNIAWDVAGAAVEFTLSPGEEGSLIEAIERVSGFAVDRAQVPFVTLCYSAFQLGYYREAVASVTDSEKAAHVRAAAERYSSCLARLLGRGTEPNAAPAD